MLKGVLEMGADLYLPTVVQACHERYGSVATRVDLLVALLDGEAGQLLAEAGQQLHEALVRHAWLVGTMDPALFDLVAESADLAQGECAAATRTLAARVAELIGQADASPQQEEGLGVAAPGPLSQDLLTLLTTGPDEALLRRGARVVAQGLRHLPDPLLAARAAPL